MPSQEEIDEQQQLLTIHRRTLAILLKQRAEFTSTYAPPAIEHGIDEARQNIRGIKRTLKEWGETVIDHPGDSIYTDTGPVTPQDILKEIPEVSSDLSISDMRMIVARMGLFYRGNKRSVRLTPFLIRPKIMIYWHKEGLTKIDAIELVGLLDDIDAEGVIAKHVKETAPDAIYIGADAPAAIVRSILEKLTHKIAYIFPVDYPDPECGALSDFVMSVGLQSTTNKEFRAKNEEPIRLKRGQLKKLTEPGLNDAEFRHRLMAIASHNE